MESDVKLHLDPRLSSAAELVPHGAALLDVGTDHGYLPAWLILSEKIPYAGASDVNESPLLKAVATAERYGVTDRMSFYLSDGLRDIPDIEKYGCISICGMGGELIARIIDECSEVKERKIPLILQPMTAADRLSEYLASAGFDIIDERISLAAGKLYRTMLAVYDGNVRDLTAIEHILGKVNITRGRTADHYADYVLKYINKYKKIIAGKRSGGVDHSVDAEIYAALCDIAKSGGINFEDT